MNNVELKRIIVEELKKMLKEEGELGSDPKVSQSVWAKMSDPTFFMQLSNLLQKAGLSVGSKGELIRAIMNSKAVSPMIMTRNNVAQK